MTRLQTIRAGYYVALRLKPGTAPSSCYIGLVQAADDYGLRINPVHWDNELDMIVSHTEDLFAPWPSITSMLVCTDEQPSRRFVKDKAPSWQAEIEAMDTKG